MDNVNQQVPPVPSQPQVKAANNLNFLKIIAYGFVIVSIGISIAVGGYLLGANKAKPQPVPQVSATPTPTPDPTADWQIHLDIQKGFSIKYPQDWKFDEQGDKNILLIDFCGPKYWDKVGSCRMAGKGSTAAISLRNDSLDIDRAGFCSQNPMNIFCGKILSKKDTAIDGAIGEIFEMEVNNDSLIALWKKSSADERMYELSADDLVGFPENRGIFNQMLSTFKFLNQAAQITPTSDPTAGWKTYTGNGYSIKYPENFGANVWRAFIWPPTTRVVSINEDPVQKGCANFPVASPNATVKSTSINNINFKLYNASDAAAGSSYNSYCYVTTKDQNYYVIDFVIKTTNGCGQNCSVYCGTPNETACRNFDIVKEVEKPIQDILSTFKFAN